MKGRHSAHWSLIWQAVLIVLPVAVLSAIGFSYLRFDRAAVEQEARERAQVLMPQAAAEIGRRVGKGLRPQSVLHAIIAGGRIQSPPDYSRLPVPPDWPEKLPPGPAQLWGEAQDALYRRGDRPLATKLFRSLADSNAPSAARINAEYNLLLLGSGGTAAALARKAGDILTESGAPVGDLALLFALRRGDAAAVKEVPSRVREHPSFLTPELLDAAPGLNDLKAEWATQEETRALLRQLAPLHMDCSARAAVEMGNPPFLAWGSPQRDGCHVSLVPPPVVAAVFDALAAVFRVASRCDAVEVSGNRWSIRRGQENARILLATATASLAFEAPYPFTVRVFAAPETLYAGYRRRFWFTTALILAAASAALIGLVGLWRGFRRQMRLSEMKSNFVSSVSHELRAPIAAVRLMAEGLEQGRIAGEAKQRDYFHLIVQECRRLSSLVENVLDFSRIDQGRKQYSFEPVDAAALVRHTVALMQPCAAERQVALELADPPAEIAGLEPRWDHQAVEQSLVNLIDNAIKHSPPGAAVTVRMEAGPPWIRVWVEDHGPGIPPEAQARIFDLFYRHGSELRRETRGAGIGLSIVKHAAEAHGGRVLVKSAVGEGSRFALELPINGARG